MSTEQGENHDLLQPLRDATFTSDANACDVQDLSLVELKPILEEAAATVEGDASGDYVDDEEDDESSDGFEFAFVVRDRGDLPPSITADDLFSGGRLLPAYPVFNRDLLLSSSSSSDADSSAEAVKVENRVPLRRLFTEESIKLGSGPSSSEAPASAVAAADGVVVGEYCEWTPRSAPQSPERWKKSASMGMGSSSSRRWRLRDLVVGRSHSDGKEKFIFIAPTPRPRPPSKEKAKTAAAAAPEAGGEGKGGRRKSGEMDMVTAHRLYYGKSGAAGGQGAKGGGRRSFLPYREELLGLFTNVNGLSWPHNR